MQQSRIVVNDFKALGSIWYIEVFNFNKDDKYLKKLSEYLKEIISKFDDDFSRFKENSYISKLNRFKMIDLLDFELLDLVRKGIEFYQNTERVFNFGLANELTKLGYGKKKFKEQSDFKSNAIDTDIVIKDDRILLNNNVSLDLGGFGKGYLVDKLGQILKEKFRISDFLINGGGDILVTSCNGEEISVYLQDPLDIEKAIAKIQIKDSAICSSSTYKRIWKDNKGNDASHILDSLNSFNPLLSRYSFVSADSCCIADMLATTFCIRDDIEFVTRLKQIYTFSLIRL